MDPNPSVIYLLKYHYFLKYIYSHHQAKSYTAQIQRSVTILIHNYVIKSVQLII